MTQPEDSKPYANPYCDKDSFEKAIKNSATFGRAIDHMISVMYFNLRNQEVVNQPNGQLLTSSMGVFNPAENTVQQFHFALLTENGHVAAQS